MDKSYQQVQSFYNNETMRNSVKDYFKDKMDEAIIKRVYNGGDVSHIKDAKELIDTIFSRMESEFAVKIEKKKTDILD